MPKESTIQHYTSSTTGSAPLAANLASGELAINTADEKVFYKNHNGVVLSLSQTKDLSGAFASKSAVVTSFNGTTGAVGFTIPLATTSLTGTASFNPNRFQVSATGNVDLLAAYQATGDTVITVAGSGIGIATSGKTDTLYNIGVTSFNGLTGNITLTGDGGSSLVLGNTVVTNRVATSSVTGVASFNGTRFSVSAAGAVDLAAAFQATGDTIAAGSFINFSQSGTTKTLNNIGVQTLNGFTGGVQVTGSGAVLHSVSGTTTTLGARISSTSVTGVASFNNVHFTVDTTGHVKLGSAYQVTGQTVVSGGASQLVSTSGNTVTIDNRIATTSLTGVASFSSTFFTVSATGSVQLATAYQATGSGIATVPLATTSLTGTASFNPNRFQVSATGNVDLLAAYQATGDTVITVAGSGIAISTSGKTDTLYNIGVTAFNGLTGNISLTGDGGSSLVLGNTVVTNRLATTSLTGVASFNSSRFTVTATGHVDIASGSITTALLNTSSWTFRDDADGTEGVQLGTSLNITGGPGVRVRKIATDVIAVQGITASTSQIGIASFNNQSFIVGTTGHVRLNGLLGSGAVPFSTILGDGLTTSSAFQFDILNNKLTVANATSPSRNFSLEASSTIAYLNANGAVDFVIGHAAGNPITIGDYDGAASGTKVVVDINNDLINLYSNANPIILDSPGLTVANWLSVGGGATFSGNVTLGNEATDTTTIYGTKIVNEGVYANGSLRTANISFANGQVQTLTGVGTGATGTTAIYFTGAPSTGAASVTMIITNGGLMTGTGMTAWGGNIKWPSGIKPVLTSSGVDVVSFVTPDAGTTIYGFVGGLGFS